MERSLHSVHNVSPHTRHLDGDPEWRITDPHPTQWATCRGTSDSMRGDGLDRGLTVATLVAEGATDLAAGETVDTRGLVVDGAGARPAVRWGA